MKYKQFTKVLTSQDLIDIKLSWINRGLIEFSINYRANIKDKWYEIYRVDNYHGFLHEQKFWRNPEPICIIDKDSWRLKEIFDHYLEEVLKNFRKYRSYFEKVKKE